MLHLCLSHVNSMKNIKIGRGCLGFCRQFERHITHIKTLVFTSKKKQTHLTLVLRKIFYMTVSEPINITPRTCSLKVINNWLVYICSIYVWTGNPR